MRTITSLLDEHDYGYNEDQQKFIADHWFSKDLSLIEIAEKIFKKKLTGTSSEVKKLKLYTIKIGRAADREKDGAADIDFTQEQRDYIQENASSLSPMELARIVFKNNSLAPLSKEVKLMDKYVKYIGVTKEPVSTLRDSGDYKTTESIVRLIKKVNTAKPDLKLSEDKLVPIERKGLEQLKVYLGNQRFLATINAIRNEKDRDMFEAEYINGVFGKELNSEEVNMYISLVSDYILQKQIKQQLDMLNDEMVNSVEDEDKQIKISLTEAFGKKSQEYDACAKRIQKMQESLSGMRSKRVGDQVALNSSLVMFVELWKQEEDRKRMIMIAKARNLKIAEEIDKIEDESEYIARVMGVSREEMLNG